MAIGEQPTPPPLAIDFVDWNDLYNHINDDEPIIDGLAYRGRWTAIASQAKAGKSTIILALAVAATQNGHHVIYIDAEMGRGDILDRVESWMQLTPNDLTNLHYTDLPPKLDNIQGATALWNTVDKIQPDLVIIDGLNGVVNGAENDDTTWRDMYEWAIAPLKTHGVAVLSADNTGKDRTQGPRGSSVKLDKADAIIILERTETGVKLTASHRRTASYPQEQEYTVEHADETGPPMTVTRVGPGTGAPAGTNHIINALNHLGAPVDISRRTARKLLKDNDYDAPRDIELGTILRIRREEATATLTGSEPVGNHPEPPLKVVPKTGNHSDKSPANPVVPARGSTKDPPLADGSGTREPNTVPETLQSNHIPTAEDVGL